MIITTYDEETQAAIDELDRNIKVRTKYLSTHTFGCKAVTVLLKDEVLNQLQRIKAEVIAKATVTHSYELEEVAPLAIPAGVWSKSVTDRLGILPLDIDDEIMRNLTPERIITIKRATRLGKTEQMIKADINASYGEAVANSLSSKETTGHCKRMPFPKNEQQFAADIEAVLADEIGKQNNPWAELGRATQKAVDAMKKFNEVAKNSGVSGDDIEQHLNLLIQDAVGAISSCGFDKVTPVFDEMDKFHNEPLPESLAVPRGECYPVQVDLNEFRIYKEDTE